MNKVGDKGGNTTLYDGRITTDHVLVQDARFVQLINNCDIRGEASFK